MPNNNEQKTTAKNTAILGAAQMIQMGTTLIRAKAIAIILGVAGTGANTLILTALMMMQQFSSMGIFQSGVREMAAIDTNNPEETLNQKAKFRTIFLKLTLLCSLIGGGLMVLLSPILSYILFDNYQYTPQIAAASIALVLLGLYSGYSTIMQATQNLRLMAKATISGAIVGVALSVICYLLLGQMGIVPGIIAGYLAFYIAFRHFERKIGMTCTQKIEKDEFWNTCKPVLKLGIVLMAGMIVATLYNFALNAFISNKGSVEEVGLYQSAASMITQGMAIINIILASDFFPRIAKVHTNHNEMQKNIRAQINIMLYIIAPIAAVIIAFANQIVWLLLSPEFQQVAKLLQIMALGLVFKVMWTTMSYVILAKGDKRAYFLWDALIGNGIVFLLGIGGFYYGNLELLAWAYPVGAITMMVLLCVVGTIRCKAWIEWRGVGKTLFYSTVIFITFVASTAHNNTEELNILKYTLCATIALYSIYKLSSNIKIIDKLKSR